MTVATLIREERLLPGRLARVHVERDRTAKLAAAVERERAKRVNPPERSGIMRAAGEE